MEQSPFSLAGRVVLRVTQFLVVAGAVASARSSVTSVAHYH